MKRVKTLTKQNTALTAERDEALKAVEAAKASQGKEPSPHTNSAQVAELEAKINVRVAMAPSWQHSRPFALSCLPPLFPHFVRVLFFLQVCD